MTVPVEAAGAETDIDGTAALVPLHLLGPGVDRRNMDDWLVRVSRAKGTRTVGAPPRRHLRIVVAEPDLARAVEPDTPGAPLEAETADALPAVTEVPATVPGDDDRALSEHESTSAVAFDVADTTDVVHTTDVADITDRADAPGIEQPTEAGSTLLHDESVLASRGVSGSVETAGPDRTADPAPIDTSIPVSNDVTESTTSLVVSAPPERDPLVGEVGPAKKPVPTLGRRTAAVIAEQQSARGAERTAPAHPTAEAAPAAEPDAPRSDTPRPDTPRLDTPRPDTPRLDTPRPDTASRIGLAPAPPLTPTPSLLPTPSPTPSPAPAHAPAPPVTQDAQRAYELRPAIDPKKSAIVVAVRGVGIQAPAWTGRTDLFRSVSLDVHAGELIAIVGPAGAGKSALLDALAGLRSTDSGDVLLDGHALSSLTSTDRARQWAGAMGFASPAVPLVSTMTVLENIELPLQLAGWTRADARAEAEAALTVLRLGNCGGVTPDQLSDGEQRKVCVARAIVGQPRVIWADEPTAGLDPESADNVVHVLRQLTDDGVAVVTATHDASLLAHAHRIVDLRNGVLRDVSRRKVIDACQRLAR